METVQIKGEVRESLGKQNSAAIRAAGKVPCVLYGGGEQVHFSASSKDFKKLVYTPYAYLSVLEIDGKTYNAILQDTQFDPVSDELRHADFLLVQEGKPVTVKIPVTTSGVSKGVVKGGSLQIILRKLKVRGNVDAIPKTVNVDMTDVDLGESVQVKNLPEAEGYDVLNAPNAVVTRVQVTRTARMSASEASEETAEAEAETAE